MTDLLTHGIMQPIVSIDDNNLLISSRTIVTKSCELLLSYPMIKPLFLVHRAAVEDEAEDDGILQI